MLVMVVAMAVVAMHDDASGSSAVGESEIDHHADGVSFAAGKSMWKLAWIEYEKKERMARGIGLLTWYQKGG